ncbi:DUF3489 domain-containing protein [Cognatishimia sp. D5M38]|jgi:predicted HTH transcriptional regulator|uniref:DUF3489 domain-containing protein n=2 Tax=Cognatishimia TaxID=2211635 RepID=A0A975EQK8_9RHOB|nr:DUF3489 domain-containing protein [Cognatishimia activa]QTN36378.1 DUF3489 domain-containing protein [Cognatishimia activa]
MMTESAQESKVAKAKAVKSGPERQEQLINLLSRKAGATTKQMQEAFGWQPHTARAAISTLRKAGVSVERTDAKRGAVYHIVALV